MKLPRFSIRSKVLAACLLLILFMSGFSAAMVVFNNQMGELALGLYDKTFVGMHYAHKVQTAFVRLKASHTDADLPLTGDDDKAAVAAMEDDLDVAADRAVTPRQKSGLATAKSDINSLIDPAAGPDRPTFSTIDKHLKHLTQRFADDAIDRRDEADVLINKVRIVIFGLAAAALAGALGLAAFLIFGVLRPLRQLIKSIATIDEGESKATAKLSARGDEISQMLQALISQRDAAAAFQEEQRRAEQAQARDNIERQRADTDKVQQAAQAQAQIVRSLSTSLGRLAEGDLTAQIGQAFPEEFERLRSDFNEALQHLRDALSAVAVSAEGVNAGAGAINDAADDLSRRTDQQSTALAETSAAMDELNATVRRTADGQQPDRHLRARRSGRPFGLDRGCDRRWRARRGRRVGFRRPLHPADHGRGADRLPGRLQCRDPVTCSSG